ncbi:protein spinster homolog 1 [Petromyzon marinus]|uniref:Protein spinster homolog 1-like n=1 Tax=Petromyzon marinus TaxID=7757 RepID=A0AAJ7WMP5_PETMA|nr:protein spinster homolog 1-like [Petromyzon marinus]
MSGRDTSGPTMKAADDVGDEEVVLEGDGERGGEYDRQRLSGGRQSPDLAWMRRPEAVGGGDGGGGGGEPLEASLPRDVHTVTGVSRHRSLAVVLILFYVNLLNYMDRFTVAGILVQIQNYFSINNTMSGLLTTVFICSYMLLAPIFGYLGDRFNRKMIMSVGIAVWSVTTLGSSFIPKENFWAFLLMRGLVGIGEASYSTIAPTVIADLYTRDKRTRMLSIFYFAIPVGSGLGYILGANLAQLTGNWQWGLRVTPVLGVFAVLLIFFVVPEPPRGAIEQETGVHLSRTSWLTDLKCLARNQSLLWSSLGFTSVSFVTGALALWSPEFLSLAEVVQGRLRPCVTEPCEGYSQVSLIFGVLTCVSGFIGVGVGAEIARRYKKYNARADPLVCAFGLLSSAPFLFLSLVTAESNTTATYFFIFCGETLLCLNWAIVADILLYVVIPTRRSTAESVQILMSHLLGDAFSPYLIGKISDSIKGDRDSYLWRFLSLEYALLICAFVCTFGGACFLKTATVIEQDRERAEMIVSGTATEEDLLLPHDGRPRSVYVNDILS